MASIQTSSTLTSTTNCIPSQERYLRWVYAKRSSPGVRSEVVLSKVGKWMLFLDKKKRNSSGLTELDSAWLSLTPLVEEKVLCHAKCSTARDAGGNDKDTGVVICYTGDYADKTRVREAAEAIHRIVKLRSPIYYKTDEATRAGVYSHYGDKNVSIYRFCPDSTFYERGAGSSWIQVGEGGSSESLIPSKVTWLRWLWVGPKIHPPLSDEELKSGKWFLFLDQEEEDSKGLTELDKAWTSVARLVREGILLSAKCCTAAARSYCDPIVGVIACYTSDFTDKKNVKEVADAIHICVQSSGTMYYKTDEGCREGMCSNLDNENISIYKYVDCQFYERDEELEWRLVVFN